MSERVAAIAEHSSSPFDVERLREDFPAIAQHVRGKPLAYLDNVATAQKPRRVLEALERYYSLECANVHRGVYRLAEQATASYEAARDTVQRFLGASRREEIVFTRGTTESINLVAQTFVRRRLREGRHGRSILLTEMEHHSNIVPWQLLAEETGARVLVVPIDDRGDLVLEEAERLLSEDVCFASLVHVSNALGTVNPVERVIAWAHERGVPVLLDGAQSAPHLRVNVQALGCDFFALSGHKIYGPTGIGVLYGRHELLADMPPYQGGGDMIRSVAFSGTTFADPPARFEAGTPHIAGAIGLGAALEYLEGQDLAALLHHEEDLLRYATERLSEVPGLRIVGTAARKASVLSFVLSCAHPHDVATILDSEGIAVRAGHHCAQPVMDHYGVPATTRASFAFYNTREEVDRLAAAVARVQEIFA